MNTNENESLVSEGPRTAEERLRSLLCATLLGEASEAERAEIERALEASAELRAERERLERTIGLVRSSLGSDAGGESLSAAAASALGAAAARRAARPAARPWYASHSFRAAASVALVLGAWGVWKARQGQTEGLAPARAGASTVGAEGDTLVASAEKKREGAKNQAAEGAENGRLLDKDGGETGAAAPAAKPAEVAMQQNVEPLKEAGVGRADEKSVAIRANEPTPFEVVDHLEKAREGALGVDRFQAEAERAPAPATGAVARVETQPAPASDDFKGATDTFLEAQNGGIVRSRPAAPAGPATEGARQSPSAPRDHVATRPASPGTPGPTTPAGPLARGEVAAGKQVSAEELRRMRALGYGGGDAAGGQELLAFLDEGRALTEADVTNSDELFLRAERFDRGLRDGRRPIDPLELDRRIDLLLQSCRPLPHERPRDMFFRWWGDNAFEWTRHDAQSTFSIDVDTASYALARRYLRDGVLPEKAQVRTEEFLNYFKADVPAPVEDAFAVSMELAPSLFAPRSDHWLLRVVVRGREVSRPQRQPLRLTFVIDVSGSMREDSRLELVKHSLRLLLGELDGHDAISIVTFSTDARLVLPMTSAAQRGVIESAIHPLQPEHSTNVEAGLRLGYEQALANLMSEGNNRVVLLTDGVANVGVTDPVEIASRVDGPRRAGIYLNTIGVGMGNHNDHLLEQLADKGDGLCNYVDDAKEARRALVDNFTGAFEPIARDVKVQVEFDPAQVEQYRLLGYENRAIADQDFRNDAIDAGEVGAGHQVVALYEVVRGSTPAEAQQPFAIVRLRWKAPYRPGAPPPEGGEAATERAFTLRAGDSSGSFAGTSPGFRKSALVAQFAEFLRRSVHARGDSLDLLIAEARKLEPELKDPDFNEFVQLLLRSDQLLRQRLASYDDIHRCLDELRWRCYHEAEANAYQLKLDEERLRRLHSEREDLERQIRDLIRKRCEQG